MGGEKFMGPAGSGRDAVPAGGGSVVSDEQLMDPALDEARSAPVHGDVPVGAVVWLDGEVIARRHNEREHAGDPTAHAEMLVLRDAAACLGSWRLHRAVVAVTLEPCPMCAGALQQARVARVVYGADDPKAGALGSLYNLGADPRLNHEFEVVPGVRAGECAALLREFFSGLRDAGPGAAVKPGAHR